MYNRIYRKTQYIVKLKKSNVKQFKISIYLQTNKTKFYKSANDEYKRIEKSAYFCSMV